MFLFSSVLSRNFVEKNTLIIYMICVEPFLS